MEMNAFEAESDFSPGDPGDLKIFNPAGSGIGMVLVHALRGEYGVLAPGSWLGVPGTSGSALVTWVEKPMPRQPFLRRLRLAIRMVFTGR